MSFIKQFLYYLEVFWRYAGIRLPIMLAMIALGSLVEIFGIALLLPLLSLEADAPPDNKFSQIIFQLLQWVGITPTLLTLLAIIVFTFTIKGLIVFGQHTVLARLQAMLRLEIQLIVADKVAAMNYRHFAKTESGHLINLITKEVERFTGSFTKFARLIVSLIYVSFYLVVAGLLRWDLTLLIVLLSGVAAVPLHWLTRRTRELSLQVSEQNAATQVVLIQMIQGFPYLRATHSIGTMFNHLKGHVGRLASLTFRINFIGGALGSVVEPIAIIALGLLIAHQVAIEGRALAEIAVLALLFYRTFARVLQLQVEWQKFNSVVGGVHVVESAIRELDANREACGTLAIPDLHRDIRFQHVTVRQGGRQVLSNVDVDIPVNSSIGIVGESGAGKTTFINLLTGLLDPDSGRVLIGDVDLRHSDRASLREKIGYVTQDPILFNDTVANNISLWRGDPSDPDVRRRIAAAAAAAHCTKFVADLEHGFDTVIGDRGIRLSGGQRQRIAIARELFREPQLIIFDEATSALDSESESFIRQSIHEMKGKRTILIVAHRLSTTRECNRILVFSKGKVIEFGSFEDLYNDKSSAFRALCDAQQMEASATP